MTRRDRRTTEMPLLAWGEQLRVQKQRRRKLGRRTAIIAAGIALVGLTMVSPPAPRLVWNASASAPIGLYRVSPGAPVSTGDMVVAWLPAKARALAAGRRYLPATVPAVKRVAAGPGACVCAIGGTIRIDGRAVATRLRADRLGRPLPWWTGCHVLGPDERLLLMAGSAASFDGRYFGVSRMADIIGKATLLWPR